MMTCYYKNLNWKKHYEKHMHMHTLRKISRLILHIKWFFEYRLELQRTKYLWKSVKIFT